MLIITEIGTSFHDKIRESVPIDFSIMIKKVTVL